MTDPRHKLKEKADGWYYCLLGCFGLITIAWIILLGYVGYLIIPIISMFYGKFYAIAGVFILGFILWAIIKNYG